MDAWACGVLAYELLVGCPPFGMSTREGSIKAILSSEPKIPAWLPAGASNFIQAALTKKPSHRPAVTKLLQHPWIQEQMCDLHSLQCASSACIASQPHVMHDLWHPVVALSQRVSFLCQCPATRIPAHSTISPRTYTTQKIQGCTSLTDAVCAGYPGLWG